MKKSLTKLLIITSAFCVSMLLYQNAHAQITVSGKVVSESNEALPGVNILLKGTTQGTTTDVDGAFRLQVPGPESVLVLSYVGYLNEEITVGNQTSLDIRLMPDLVSLQEVVVIGYGTQKKGEVTSAVASLKQEDFTPGAMRDASELIKGKVAGLTINNGSGDPSRGPNISLRGVASLKGGTTPLILINGVPGDFNTVSPADIVSIDVLKDASAAAIYGTRGANGVILITTKTANKNAAPSLSYSHYSAVSTLGRKADFLDADDFRSLVADGATLPFVDEGHSTDWLDQITRDAYMQSHNLSLQGGNSSTNYIATVNYMDQDGVFKGSYNKEFRVSLDVNQYMLNDKLKLNINLLRGTQTLGALGDGRSFNPLIYRQALIRNPTARPKDDEGKWTETSRFQYQNPVALIEETDGIIQNDWTRLTSNITLYLLEGWETNLMLATERKAYFRGYSESKQHYSARSGKNGFASRGDDDIKTDYLELTSRYSKTIQQHTFSVLGGYSYQYNLNQGGWANNFDFPTDQYSYNNLGSGNALLDGRALMDSYKNDNTLIGFFGRISYGFDDRFNLLASIRREGSSKFGDNYKWGTFPSVSAGWTLSNESFLDESSVVSNLKLRAGYGVTGVIPRDSYLSKTILGFNAGYFYNDGKWINGVAPQSNPNPDLRWEKTREFNIGVDFGIFNDRISGSIDGYVKRTKDMLWDYSVPQPPYLFETILANVGEMENKGIEILLNTTPVKSGDFEWNSNVTFSHNRNELLSLSNDLYQIEGDFINTGDAGDPISFPTHRLEVGQSLGNFWGLKSVDIDDNGVWIIETKEGERKVLSNALYNDTNKQYLGNGIPKYYAGWINTVRYKNFDLSVVLNGAFDFQILNFQRMFYENPTINYNMLSSAFDNVYGKRPLKYSQTYVSYYIEDGDYVKLENITLGYKVNVTSMPFIKSLRVYVSGANLATITGYKGIDPEIARDEALSLGNDSRDKYPTVRTYTIGLNINF